MTDNNSIDSDILNRRPHHAMPMPTKGFDKKNMCVIFDIFFQCQGGQQQTIKETDKPNIRVTNYWGDSGRICTVRHPIHLILEFFSKAKRYG